MAEPLSPTLRPWLACIPQAGWGGTTLAGLVEIIGMRPDAAGDEAECRQVLDALVAAGLVQTVEGERWELTEAGHDSLIAPLEAASGAHASQVLLELQPGVGSSGATAEAS